MSVKNKIMERPAVYHYQHKFAKEDEIDEYADDNYKTLEK